MLGLWLLVVTGEVLAGVILVGTGGVLTGMVRAFLVVRIAVDESTLRVRLGPFGFTLDGRAIEEVRVAPYRRLAYGGRGLRWGKDDGRSARGLLRAVSPRRRRRGHQGRTPLLRE